MTQKTPVEDKASRSVTVGGQKPSTGLSKRLSRKELTRDATLEDSKENPGRGKTRKARAKGIVVITEKEYRLLLNIKKKRRSCFYRSLQH